jgi:hypothetical protein
MGNSGKKKGPTDNYGTQQAHLGQDLENWDMCPLRACKRTEAHNTGSLRNQEENLTQVKRAVGREEGQYRDEGYGKLTPRH